MSDLDQLIRRTLRRPVLAETLCNHLGLSSKKLDALITTGNRAGYEIRTTDGHVFSRPVSVGLCDVVPVLGSKAPGRYNVAVATDWHCGSKHFDRAALVSFLRTAKREYGCSKVVVTGDILDGNKEVLLADQNALGFDHQADIAVDVAREVGGDLEWVAIDGNHDGYFSSSIGFVSGRVLRDRMRVEGVNWHFAGVCLGRSIIHGAAWHLWHPMGGASTRNAVRRTLNERIEGLNEPADIVALGHFHKYASLPVYPEAVHGIAGGTFQRKRSEFANRITRGWDVGGAIVSYTVTRNAWRPHGVEISEISADFIAARP